MRQTICPWLRPWHWCGNAKQLATGHWLVSLTSPSQRAPHHHHFPPKHYVRITPNPKIILSLIQPHCLVLICTCLSILALECKLSLSFPIWNKILYLLNAIHHYSSHKSNTPIPFEWYRTYTSKEGAGSQVYNLVIFMKGTHLGTPHWLIKKKRLSHLRGWLL